MRRLALLLALTLAPLIASADSWSTSPIDSQTGWTVSLQVDEEFHAHVAYWSPYGGFKYAFYDGTAWEVDTLPSPITLAENDGVATRLATPEAAQLIFVGRTSLALTSETPWVAYMKVVTSHQEDGPLKVGHKVGSAWVTEDIDDRCASGVRIAANEEGIIYLTYRPSAQGYRFMIRDGAWTGEALDLSYGPYALTVDRNGTPWILYTDGTALWVARRDGPGVWSPLMVDNTPGSSGSALQFDSQNRPCVAYTYGEVGTSTSRLAYATWTGSDWVSTWITAAGDRAMCESLVLDESNVPWISFRDYDSHDISVAHRVNGNWSVDLVDTPSSNYSSMTIDALGHHWLAYNTDALRLARTGEPTGIGDQPLAPTALRLAIAGTNPVRPGAPIALRLASPTAGTVRIAAFDLAGRRLASEQSTTVGAGVTSLPWTAPAAQGLCLVRAMMGDRSSIARVMVVR